MLALPFAIGGAGIVTLPTFVLTERFGLVAVLPQHGDLRRAK